MYFSDIFHIPLHTFIYLYIPLCTFIYLYIPPSTPGYLYIRLYTPIYIKISNIRKMRSDIRSKNGHKTNPRASPMARIWHAPSYHTPKGFFMPKGRTPILIKLMVLSTFGGVIKVHNSINRGSLVARWWPHRECKSKTAKWLL